MKAKKNVNISGCVFEIGYAAGVAFGILRKLDSSKDFVVTSARDSQHNPGSLHYLGKAIDIRTRHLSFELTTRFFNALKAELDSQGFDTIYESDHIHVEFQPKSGESFLKIVD